MFGMTNVANTSPSAVLAGPGWPTFVLQSVAFSSSASLSGGWALNGSLRSHSPSFGTVLA